MVALFLLGRVYVANAGDCRACIFDPTKSYLIPMSYDFTPESDRQRIQLIAFQRPELLRHPITKEKLYNRHVLSRKVIIFALYYYRPTIQYPDVINLAHCYRVQTSITLPTIMH